MTVSHILLAYKLKGIFRLKNLSPTYWPVSPPVSLPRTLLYATIVPITHRHSRKRSLLPRWSEYPTVHCNGTSGWSLIGLDHRTPLRDGCQLVVVAQWGGGLCYQDSFLSCFCISSSYEEKCLCWQHEISKK